MFTHPTQLSGFPYRAVEFEADASLVDPLQVKALLAALEGQDGDGAGAGATDLLVVSHGWNNDRAEALALYRRLFGSVRTVARGRFDDRRLVVAGVHWPSKRFADSDLIPGGAASADEDLPMAALLDDVDELRTVFGGAAAAEALDAMAALVPELADSAAAQRAFVDAVRALLPQPGLDDELGDELPQAFWTRDGADILDELGAGWIAGVSDDGPGSGGGSGSGGSGGIGAIGGPGGFDDSFGGEEGGGGGEADVLRGAPTGQAAMFGGVLSGIRNGGRALLNITTYWTMKQRAGIVGQQGLVPVLRTVRDAAPELRIHLAGHSFGGRLVTSAALGEARVRRGKTPLSFASLSLLQAAFSHNGFAPDARRGEPGFFRAVVAEGRVTGPIIVTHTHNDRANTLAYPLASRINRDATAAFGGPTDVFGAIGANGAQRTPEVDDGHLLGLDGTYRLAAGRIHNLEASTQVLSHGDVGGTAVAHALISAMTTT